MKTDIKYKFLNQCLFLLFAINLTLFSCGKITHEKFDSHLWKTANLNSEENMSLRWDMMNDLRNNQTLIGMTKNQVVEILGNPDFETKNELSYYLGYSRRGINTGRLTLTLDGNGTVTNLNVWQG